MWVAKFYRRVRVRNITCCRLRITNCRWLRSGLSDLDYIYIMHAGNLDGKGLIVVCPACGSRNRIPYEQLGHSARCGKCKSTLPTLAAPVQIDGEPLFD